MSQQEVFDTVIRHLYRQGCRSTNGAEDNLEVCAIWGILGRRDPLGCLLDATNYTEEFEHMDFIEVLTGLEFPPESFSFMQELSSIHDMANEDPSTELYEFGLSCDLTWPDDVPTEGWNWIP